MVHSGPRQPAGQLPGQLQEVLSGIERQASSIKHQATSCDKMSRVNLSDSNHLAFVLKIDFNERYKNMLVKEALKITDSFTKTSKMPGLSYSLPAWACKTGQKLAKIPGTPCFGCYAKKGTIQGIQLYVQLSIEGWTQLKTRYGLKRW